MPKIGASEAPDRNRRVLLPSDDRLPTGLWVQAQLRRCTVEAVPATVIHRGDPDRGTLILKLNLLDGACRVLTQATTASGALGWLPAFKGEAVPEAEADAYIARARARDADLWAVEIEHRQGWHPFEAPLIPV